MYYVRPDCIPINVDDARVENATAKLSWMQSKNRCKHLPRRTFSPVFLMRHCLSRNFHQTKIAMTKLWWKKPSEKRTRSVVEVTNHMFTIRSVIFCASRVIFGLASNVFFITFLLSSYELPLYASRMLSGWTNTRLLSTIIQTCATFLQTLQHFYVGDTKQSTQRDSCCCEQR